VKNEIKQQKAILVYAEDDVLFQEITVLCMESLVAEGYALEILDMRSFSYPHYKNFPKWVYKAAGLGARQESIFECAERLGARIIPRKRKRTRTRPRIAISKLIPSTRSLAITLLRDEKPFRHPLLYPVIFVANLMRARSAFNLTADVIATNSPDLLVVPNGRFPYQKATTLAAEFIGVKLMYFEFPMFSPTGYFIGKFESTDRNEIQKEVKRREELGENFRQPLETASAWIESRVLPGSPVNPYAANWASSPSPEGNVPTHSYAATFFTSSQDEYWSLESWKGLGWRDQYEAFDSFAKNLKGMFALRVHPNFVNKSIGQARAELKRIAWLTKLHPNMQVVWPEDSVNSYELAEKSERIVVFGSTIGLEASCMGKSVWCTGNSIYDRICDVRIYEPGVGYNKTFYDPWQVDSDKNLKMLASLMSLDIEKPVKKSNETFQVEEIPTVFRMINILRIGSLAFIIILIKRLVAKRVILLMLRSHI
jgi:hypothetical protein